jgi:hypothetical protein
LVKDKKKAHDFKQTAQIEGRLAKTRRIDGKNELRGFTVDQETQGAGYCDGNETIRRLRNEVGDDACKTF